MPLSFIFKIQFFPTVGTYVPSSFNRSMALFTHGMNPCSTFRAIGEIRIHRFLTARGSNRKNLEEKRLRKFVRSSDETCLNPLKG